MCCQRLTQVLGVALTASIGLSPACSDNVVVNSSSDLTTFEVRDYEYLEDQYFFLDEIYRNIFPENPNPSDLVNTQFVRVFINDFIADNDLEDNAEPGVGFSLWDPQPPREADSRAILNGGVEEGNFHELEYPTCQLSWRNVYSL